MPAPALRAVLALRRRGALLPVLSVLPLVGPAIYLMLRPKADLSK